MPAPAYDILLIAHIACAFIGFGSIAVSSLAARRGRSSADPASEPWVVRFFREGTDWPGRLIFLVPLFGLAMLFGGDRTDISKVWPWLGLGLWTVAVGFSTGLGWPAEADAQRSLAALCDGDDAEGSLSSFRAACTRMERSTQVATVCFVVAVALMLWQPGS